MPEPIENTNTLPALVTIAQPGAWLTQALMWLAAPHVARLERATKINGVSAALREQVCAPCGRAVDDAITRAMRKGPHHGR